MSEETQAALQKGEIINGVACDGFALVVRTVTGCYLLTDEVAVQRLTSKEKVLAQFTKIYGEVALDPTKNAREDWDVVHPILIHLPINGYDLVPFGDPTFGASIIQGSNSIIGGVYGIPVVEEKVLAFKALDLHDDIIAQIDLQREEIEEEEAKQEVQEPPLL